MTIIFSIALTIIVVFCAVTAYYRFSYRLRKLEEKTTGSQRYPNPNSEPESFKTLRADISDLRMKLNMLQAKLYNSNVIDDEEWADR